MSKGVEATRNSAELYDNVIVENRFPLCSFSVFMIAVRDCLVIVRSFVYINDNEMHLWDNYKCHYVQTWFAWQILLPYAVLQYCRIRGIILTLSVLKSMCK